MYEGSVVEDFWKGSAVDKQINSAQTISEYWIRSFLRSDFAVTGERGTRQLALALKRTVNSASDLEIISEINSAVNLSRNLNHQTTSIKGYTERFSMSEKTTETIQENVKSTVFNEQFRFVHPEFKKNIAYKRVEMVNGAVLTAMYDEFEQVFNRSENEAGEVTFTTQGKIRTQKYRKTVS